MRLRCISINTVGMLSKEYLSKNIKYSSRKMRLRCTKNQPNDNVHIM